MGHSCVLQWRGLLRAAINLPTVDPSGHIAGVADFDGDGQADLIWENIVSGQRVIWFMKNGVPQTSDFLPTMLTGWHIVDH